MPRFVATNASRSEQGRRRRRLLGPAAVLAVFAINASCGGSADGLGSITAPQGTGWPAPPPAGGTTTPPVPVTPLPDTSAVTPPATPPGTSTPSAVTAVAVAPATLALAAGDSTSVSATLTTTGTAPAGGWVVTWSSTDSAVATVSASGVVKALTAGVAGITASVGGRSAVSVATISAAPWVTSVVIGGGVPAMLVDDGGGPPPRGGVLWP